MARLLAPALIALAVLTVGCGGSIGKLLATVPPPVELTAGTGGLIELPASGSYRGELVVERATLKSDGNGGWTETATEPIYIGRSAATIRETRIELTQDGVEVARFLGRLRVVPANAGQPAATYVDLTAFDGNRERFNYTLAAGDPKTLRIVARTEVERSGDTARFDRYEFTLSQ